MKSTGIVRQVDGLGRIVIPRELRRVLDINSGDSLQVFNDGEMIVLGKYAPGCIFCGEASNVTSYKGKSICPSCKEELKR